MDASNRVVDGLTVRDLARAHVWMRDRGATAEEAVTIVRAYPQVDPRRVDAGELLGGLRETRTLVHAALTGSVCCLCFNSVPVTELFVDEDGQRWDMCQTCRDHEIEAERRRRM